MANDPWRDPAPFGAHAHGVRLDNVLHRCPDCPIGHPANLMRDGRIAGRSGCRTCLGAGDVTEEVLRIWTARKNVEAARGAS